MNNVVHKTLSKDQIKNNKDNCLTILSDPHQRYGYVGIINNFGQTLAGQLRKEMVQDHLSKPTTPEMNISLRQQEID